MQKSFLIAFIVFLAASTCSAVSSSSSYSLASQGAGCGSGNGSSSSYTNKSSAGMVTASKMTSTNYSTAGGSLSGGASGAGDNSGPIISNVKIDSKTLANNDYIKQTATLTATITDEVGVSLTCSSIEVDGVKTLFSTLTSASTFDASASTLSYNLNLSSGSHTIKICAVDIKGNTTSLTRAVEVSSGGAISASSVMIYPNPFNPTAGNARIAYTLNTAADISIMIFNAVGQLTFKTAISSGASGATAGYNEYSWDGKDTGGQVVGNDLYFVRIVSGGKVIGRTKLAVIK